MDFNSVKRLGKTGMDATKLAALGAMRTRPNAGGSSPFRQGNMAGYGGPTKGPFAAQTPQAGNPMERIRARWNQTLDDGGMDMEPAGPVQPVRMDLPRGAEDITGMIRPPMQAGGVGGYGSMVRPVTRDMPTWGVGRPMRPGRNPNLGLSGPAIMDALRRLSMMRGRMG